MEFRLGNLVLNERQSANGNVDSLMIIESAGIQNNEAVVRSSPAPSLKNFSVGEIQDGRAFGFLYRSFLKPLLPNVVGRDHVVGKTGGDPLDRGEQAEGQGALG